MIAIEWYTIVYTRISQISEIMDRGLKFLSEQMIVEFLSMVTAKTPFHSQSDQFRDF